MNYQRPDPVISELYENPVNRKYLLSPDKTWLVILEGLQFESIETMAIQEACLAGVKINTSNFAKSRVKLFSSIKIKNLITLKEFEIKELPEKPAINNVSFSPNNQYITFQQGNTHSVDLWIASLDTFLVRKLSSYSLNTVLTAGYIWLTDNSLILNTAFNRGKSPRQIITPNAPIIHDTTLGKKSINRTYSDLLKNEQDEIHFEFYTTSQLILYSIDGHERPIGEPSIFISYTLSPNKDFLLLKTVQHPYSYAVPYSSFPTAVTVWGIGANTKRYQCDLPLSEISSASFSAVSPSERDHCWRADKPAALYWIAAEDDGNPDKISEIRDSVWVLDMTEKGAPDKLLSLNLRFGNIYWGNTDDALIYEWWWSTRQMRIYAFDPSAINKKKLLVERSFEDSSSEPGSPIIHQNQYGNPALYIDANQCIYLKGEISHQSRKISFLKKMSLRDGQTWTLWESSIQYHEQIIDILNWGDIRILILRESETKYPNLIELNIQNHQERTITNFQNPYAALAGIQKKILQYTRNDGVLLTATLYLPSDFRTGDPPLPCLLWVYPQEFKEKGNANIAATAMANTFPTMKWDSLYPWVLKGYAILDDVSFPIIDNDKGDANNSFIEQALLNAEAVIKYSSETKYIDASRIAVGGHSYGAFMVANLMTHSSFFKVGIARSGAYNRTLTPFGFQNEDRTLWQVPDVYQRLSPFNFADKVKGPLLLIHGQADDNPGTAPMQSERYYQAIKTNGGHARLVILPHENHRYQAKESILHMLWEMERFLALL